jgi:hypothetical protein
MNQQPCFILHPSLFILAFRRAGNSTVRRLTIRLPRRRRRSVKVEIHSGPDTACFRTMLRNTVRDGQRFAGHYSWSYWGCGTECARIGIVDLITGRAYVSPFYVTGAGIRTRIYSRLILVNDPDVVGKDFGDPVPARYRPVYFLWTGRHLLQIYDDGRIGRERDREFDRCS